MAAVNPIELERHPLADMSGRRSRIPATGGRHHMAFMTTHALITLSVTVVVGALVLSIPTLPPMVAVGVIATVALGASCLIRAR
jgi:hypothetical protein